MEPNFDLLLLLAYESVNSWRGWPFAKGGGAPGIGEITCPMPILYFWHVFEVFPNEYPMLVEFPS